MQSYNKTTRYHIDAKKINSHSRKITQLSICRAAASEAEDPVRSALKSLRDIIKSANSFAALGDIDRGISEANKAEELNIQIVHKSVLAKTQMELSQIQFDDFDAATVPVQSSKIGNIILTTIFDFLLMFTLKIINSNNFNTQMHI